MSCTGAGDPENNSFYVIRTVYASGQTSDSPPVGEMDYLINRDSYNTVALPLGDETLTTADDLGQAVDATTVSRWMATLQAFDTRIVGIAGHNFVLQPGEAYFVYVPGTGTTTFTTFGDVPTVGSVQFSLERDATCVLNLLTLPLDHDSLTTADEMAIAIGGVPVISKWIPALGGFDTRIVGISGNNFATPVGYPYWPCADATRGENIWP